MQCAVIGAGIIGLSIGWELAGCGHHVSVVDPNPAQGATRAAAGMLAAITEFHYQETDLLRLSLPAAAAWPTWAQRLERDTGVGTGYTAHGTLVVAADGADREDLAALARAQQAAGLDIGELGTAAARRLEPMLAPRLAGAFSAPADAQADPRRTAAALLAALTAHPRVDIVRGAATGIVHGPGGSGVRLDDGILAADEVILATGTGLAATPVADAGKTGGDTIGGGAAQGLAGLPAGLRLPVRPIHGDVLRLRPTPGAAGPAGPTVRGLVSGHGVYVLPRPGGEVVVGATEREDGAAGVSVDGVHRLLRDALRIMPGLAHYELAESIARARPGTPDNLPLLGRIGPGLIAATGFHRHGVLLSVAAAGVVASLVDGAPGPARPRAPIDANDLSAFNPWRFS